MTLRRDESQRRPAKRKALVEYEEPGISPGRPLKKRVLDNVSIVVFKRKNVDVTSNVSLLWVDVKMAFNL